MKYFDWVSRRLHFTRYNLNFKKTESPEKKIARFDTLYYQIVSIEEKKEVSSSSAMAILFLLYHIK